MQSQKRKTKPGFSLMELVIVVVIIGIIGAIAIPRLSKGASGSRVAALKANLSILRNAIEMYKTEHDVYPTASGIENQLTKSSNYNGDDFKALADSRHPYGPYVLKIPEIPVGANEGQANAAKITDTVANDASWGWIYTEAAGTIKANTSATDPVSGKKYDSF